MARRQTIRFTRYGGSMNHVSTVVSYCSLDEPFPLPIIQQASLFSNEIVIAAADHLYNGELENHDALLAAKKVFPDMRVVLYEWSDGKPPRFWHNSARWEGFLRASSDWILFLDGDEIPDGELMKKFLSEDLLLDGYGFECYWYFREPTYQATTRSQAGIMLRRKHIQYDFIFSEHERAEHRLHPELRVAEHVTLSGRPLVHHYSWTRSKDVLLRKVSSWAHRDERPWRSIIEEEFSHPFRGTEAIHGFSYAHVENQFKI